MNPKNRCILIVDDSDMDREMIEMAFRRNHVDQIIVSVDSGEEAIRYIEGIGNYVDRQRFPFPRFILTDLKMAPMDGVSVLQHIKSKPEHKVIPVLVLSGSCDPDDIKKSYMLGAAAYLVKPQDFSELCRKLKLFYDFFMECELPEVDAEGRQLTTHSEGKLGQRFPQPASWRFCPGGSPRFPLTCRPSTTHPQEPKPSPCHLASPGKQLACPNGDADSQ